MSLLTLFYSVINSIFFPLASLFYRFVLYTLLCSFIFLHTLFSLSNSLYLSLSLSSMYINLLAPALTSLSFLLVLPFLPSAFSFLSSLLSLFFFSFLLSFFYSLLTLLFLLFPYTSKSCPKTLQVLIFESHSVSFDRIVKVFASSSLLMQFERNQNTLSM